MKRLWLRLSLTWSDGLGPVDPDDKVVIRNVTYNLQVISQPALHSDRWASAASIVNMEKEKINVRILRHLAEVRT